MSVKWLQMAGASGVMLGVGAAATAGCGPMIASEPRVKEAPAEVSVMLVEAQRLQLARASKPPRDSVQLPAVPGCQTDRVRVAEENRSRTCY